MSLGEAAIAYAKLGISVFPLKEGGKTPITPHGLKDASTDLQTVTDWWGQFPNANIGILTGIESNGKRLAVLDVDVKHEGQNGAETVKKYEAEYGELPPTATATTTTGGKHYYFLTERGSKSGVDIENGIDSRIENAYVVAPPSVLMIKKDGCDPERKKYRWDEGKAIGEIPCAPSPEWVDRLFVNPVHPNGKKTADEKKNVEANMPADKKDILFPNGTRNNSIFGVARSLSRDGIDYDVIRTIAGIFNEKYCENPLEESEIDRTCKSACGYDVKKDWNVLTAAEFPDEITEFLWYPYLPVGDYCLMIAGGGTGKSMLTCKIAADLSAGRPLPGDTKERVPCHVLFISSEDSGGMISKRLRANEADLDNCHILDREFSIDFNVVDQNNLRTLLKKYSPKLVIIDPWHGFLNRDVDINNVASIRPVLQRIAGVCREFECAMIMISHINKRTQTEDANFAATGSTDLVNAARSAVIIRYEDDPEYENCRIMVHTKSNYAGFGKTVRYKINNDNSVEWAGFSDVTKDILTEAGRKHKGLCEVTKSKHSDINTALLSALGENRTPGTYASYTYEDFKHDFGKNIFGIDVKHPKNVLEKHKETLQLHYNLTIEPKAKVKSRYYKDKDGKPAVNRGFMIIPCDEDGNACTDCVDVTTLPAGDSAA